MNPMMKPTMIFLAGFAALTASAQAQTIEPCNWTASGINIVEPWERNTRTFANGDVRITLLDTVEPAAAAFHLLVLSPPYDEVGSRQCKIVSMSAGIGFSGIDFGSLNASYDPAIGLTFSTEVQVFSPDSSGFANQQLQFTLNQSTGAMQAELY
jgi:hypothetical protein